ncbi:hypothetical protein H8784_04430 [Parabacteroides acidifaciens]|uniref:Uncharacterized protein n=1 Tax=Parabacteroides acidifaciens TaxID=2290935 RepID=A0A3D8HHJ6_9BACT|nr:hypothetical protein [Parabacteroides acidifaciens]MBC8600966.1 hypothetical protein [Parabacteroides acidifaciens]RDU50444.1 hypothetical protein DWU89_04505 [Parabacteroides acidifaciens]
MTRFRLYLAFFRSTLLISIVCGALFASLTDDFVSSVLLFIPTFGLGMDLLYKELTRKEEYFFFYNQGICKAKLLTATFAIYALSCIILYQIIRLCVLAWRSTVP